jgi:predicted small lipoprotein YifL
MGCWARHLLLAVVAVLGVGQMIAACGQKGDLYLPEPKPAAAPAPPTPVPGSEAEPPKPQH